MPSKAEDLDYLGRFREIISDPLNLLIDRVSMAGVQIGDEVMLHNGVMVPLVGRDAYYGGFSQIFVINRGVHEPLQEYLFQEMLRCLPEAPSMIELGAYWAHYSMWFKLARPRGRAVMVEADSANLQAGLRNCRRNGIEGEAIYAAVAKGRWEIDAFMRERGIERLNVLHADIEGYELEMIEGGRDAFCAHQFDYALISTHSQDLHSKVLRSLSDFGYRIEVESDVEHETTSCDGLVFASSPRATPIFQNFHRLGRMRIVASNADELLQGLVRCRNSRLRD